MWFQRSREKSLTINCFEKASRDEMQIKLREEIKRSNSILEGTLNLEFIG